MDKSKLNQYAKNQPENNHDDCDILYYFSIVNGWKLNLRNEQDL
jgi:hypothetical protein